MDIRKPAMVTLGVAAGLVAVAPFASAHQDDHGPRPAPAPSQTCSAQGGTATAANQSDSGGLVGAVAQAPVGGLNAANILCNDILNNNISGNSLIADVL
ncbi:hypothetical protein [Actinomycetospora termitidis]|uniref:Uncharacterized protein n=1 Tax=Actinomycetospora termitidis TaxID=3053470 RepID=A0ABT7M2U2_9PSEU|nr:hypothetical protein [Actinomycetospora sp. Odt1-22]MDL5154986.1 hypothetical protein [Actinomycetospora sp. Odt1-22]